MSKAEKPNGTWIEQHSVAVATETPAMDVPLNPGPADEGERTLTLPTELWDMVQWELEHGTVDKKKHDNVLAALKHMLSHAKSELKRLRKVTATNDYRKAVTDFHEEWDKYTDEDPGFFEKNPKQLERYKKNKAAILALKKLTE